VEAFHSHSVCNARRRRDRGRSTGSRLGSSRLPVGDPGLPGAFTHHGADSHWLPPNAPEQPAGQGVVDASFPL